MGFEDQVIVQKSKRTTNPGIRVIGNRIYDSANGKTCHQCRQKTTDFAASCKNLKNGKTCPIKFCQKCLFNRYGEEAEQVDMLSDWKCPKCRGKCNCSCCRKKQGLVPTGQLVKTAKASGFKSVDELLHNANNFSVSPMDGVTLGFEIVLSGEAEKENSLDGNSTFKVDTLKNQKTSPEISKKTKREGLVEISNVNGIDGACKSRSNKKSKICNEVPVEESNQIANGGIKPLHEVSEKEVKEARDSDIVGENDDPKKLAANDFAVIAEKEKIEEVPLPPGTMLEDILGIEFDPEDIGSALQFLEFCKVFGKPLDVKKGEAEAVLRELVRKKSLRRVESTLAVQVHIKLLTVILTDSGTSSPSLTTNTGKNSWLKALEDLISDESLVLKDFPLDWLNEGITGYHNLDLSKKLMLLNFLCDEALGTETLRNYMDEQNLVFSEETKEAKSKVASAREKVKCLKQKLQDETAQAVLSNVSISEHETHLSQIKSEIAEAQAELLQTKDAVPKGKQISDTVRINPVFLDDNGQTFWKLKSYAAKYAVLLQDMKVHDVDGTATEEKWFFYDSEMKDEIEKYISSRIKVLKLNKVPYIPYNESTATTM
ncbi:putative transcription factor C2H2 family [Lupinus albus]|uniref:Putative transcription factor C2H2 family n=1 Tax=Lupinus albus TaxID=3870 RepID=A0A6A4NHM8_LUPAL|nr:putative transcription factor C2H2 family [Lupinus albus]